jgi:hypothetical protein
MVRCGRCREKIYCASCLKKQYCPVPSVIPLCRVRLLLARGGSEFSGRIVNLQVPESIGGRGPS